MTKYKSVSHNYNAGTYTDSINFSSLAVPTSKDIKQITVIGNSQVAWCRSQVQNVDHSNRKVTIGYTNAYSTALNNVPTIFYYIAK